MAALREIAGRVASVGVAGERTLPVVPPLAGLFPGGALRRGSVVSISVSGSLLLGVLAGPSGQGSWVAAVGLPSLGLVAAAEAGIDLARFALVPSPGPSWPAVVAALLDAIDVVAVRPRGRVRPVDARRLAARARERGAVLVVVGDGFDGADLRLTVLASTWSGLGRGHGLLGERRSDVAVSGRGAAGRERRVAVVW
ncbi:MAG: hypothetical protein QOF60_2138 [Actinomycetota bacterium]|jgi:hypothetical protein|nr:hypothetical protein [Actinomycetota bacterium]